MKRALSAFVIVVGLAFCFEAQAEEVKLNHQDLTLNANLTLADGKNLRDGLVLIVHGTLAHNGMDTIANVVEVLAERDLSSLAINLSLGLDDRHGMYDCNVPHTHRYQDAMTEIGAWLDWLTTKGAGPVVLFGHSRGGSQAANFVKDGGHTLVKRMVLMAPATWEQNRTAASFKRNHGQELAGALTKAEAMIEAGTGGTIMANTGVLYCPGADVTAASFESYYRADPLFDTPTILKSISLPTLVIAAGKDTVVPDLPAKMKPLADGKRIHLAMIDDADHFFLDLYAEDVADLMEAFLAAGG